MKFCDDYSAFRTYMLGGQIDQGGNQAEGFNTFSEYLDTLKTGADINNAIEVILSDCSDENFEYYGDTYNFSEMIVPTEMKVKLRLEINEHILKLKAEYLDTYHTGRTVVTDENDLSQVVEQ